MFRSWIAFIALWRQRRTVVARQQRRQRTYALLHAIQRCNTQDALTLLGKGINPNVLVDEEGITFNNSRRLRTPLLMLLSTHPERWTKVQRKEAMVPGHGEVLRALLKAGADPNAVGQVLQEVSFAKPVFQERPTVARTLGSGVSWKTMTALHLAVDNDRADQVELLMAHGSDPSSLDEGFTVWERVKSVPVAQALLNGGGSPHMLNRKGQTRLQQESDEGHPNAPLSAWLEGHQLRVSMLKDQAYPQLHTIKPRARL